ncbi:DUF883 C-terminal domain-containing protein [Neokomagataea thailandica]|uniref:DUF883 C-terminal domain-containing protein n=1 Tax=Neokomagataea TaxID=1223423 RepID=UPI0008367DFF|nr:MULTISPECIES: DUF883 C-terminal domain-containing protein [Neokomagataea]
MALETCVSGQEKQPVCRSCCRGIHAARDLLEDLVIDQPWLWILLAAGLGALIGRFVFKRGKTSE